MLLHYALEAQNPTVRCKETGRYARQFSKVYGVCGETIVWPKLSNDFPMAFVDSASLTVGIDAVTCPDCLQEIRASWPDLLDADD